MTGASGPGEGAAARHAPLRDAAQQQQLEELGYVVVDLMSEDQVATMATAVDAIFVEQRSGFYASNMSNDHDARRAADALVRPFLVEVVGDDLFVDHEAFTASLLVKWPDANSSFHTHQDWTMVDERRYRTVNVWCPLVDTDEHNGALAVLPGSHRHLREIRCSPMPPSFHRSAGWEVGHAAMVKVPVRAGQAIVFDHALLHASPPNCSERWRPAVAAAFKPRSARLLHWYLPDPDGSELEVFEVGSSFFTDFDIGDRPDWPQVAVDEFTSSGLTRDELLDLCGVERSDVPAEGPPEDLLAGGAEALAGGGDAPAFDAASEDEARDRARIEALLAGQPAYKRTSAWRWLRRTRARVSASRERGADDG